MAITSLHCHSNSLLLINRQQTEFLLGLEFTRAALCYWFFPQSSWTEFLGTAKWWKYQDQWPQDSIFDFHR